VVAAAPAPVSEAVMHLVPGQMSTACHLQQLQENTVSTPVVACT
jgi:hypothetical protein